LEQLKAYIMKSNSEYERRLKDTKGSLTRSQNKTQDKSLILKKMEEDNSRKIQHRCHGYDQLVRLTMLIFIESVCQILI
jgi:hypothetical protein